MPALASTPGPANPHHVALVDQRGVMFDLAGLAGKPVAVTFVASRCSDACPIANAVFSQVQQRLHASGVKATLLTITLDPDFDSPFVMARFSKEWSPDPKMWRFVSGKKSDIFALMHAFGVAAEKGKDGIPDAHSSFIYVMDSSGKKGKTLLLSTNSADEITKLLSSKSMQVATS